ncbi:acylphosphatase [Mucilaginibacter terrae]|uniref:acylphosphatase n=1 Tax=Mucilaginibacter terrae TaxID=1955052 RepID=A0ABU3GXI8_9SPHI|nr:acylphosphatase [Mucilaginibacter terrae]MDT3404487.1 acylphosphatase [Mucilaginibacter terrae]
MIKHLNITVQGKVQGVSYRATTKAVADQLGVRGLVRNEANGDVYIEAEAEPMLMEMFLEWCQKGPDAARVSEVITHEAESKNYRNFEVVKR